MATHHLMQMALVRCIKWLHAAKIDPMANSSEVSGGVADNSTCVTRGVHVETAGSELDQGQVVVSTGEVPAAEIEAETTASSMFD